MHRLRRFLFRLRSLFRKKAIEAELDEELRVHLEMAVEARVAAGLAPEEARLAARRELGGLDQIKEAYRDERGLPWVEQLRQDLRFAARSLAKSPGFAAIAILVLALGIGVNTSTFSFINAVVLQPAVPYPEPQQLVQVFRSAPQMSFGSHSPADLLDLRAQNEVFTQLAIIDTPAYNLAVEGQPAERVRGCAVSGNYFATVGTTALHGRLFGPAEDQPGRNQVVVLGYRYWQRRFGGDVSMVGKQLRLDGEPATVIGILPEQEDIFRLWGRPEIWRPLAMKPETARGRDGYWLSAIGRMKPGVTLAQVQANLQTIAARLAHDYPLTNAGSSFFARRLDEVGGGNFFAVIMGLAAAVLLIACANLANLLLSRNSRRGREFAIRIALGATRWRLMRQMLTESMLLALVGGFCGVLGALATGRVLTRQLVELVDDPDFQVAVDVRVLLFSLALALATGLLFGIAPAWFASRTDAGAGLKQAGGGTSDRSRKRLRKVLIVTEVTLTLILLSSAGEFITGFRAMLRRETGWRTDHLLSARFALPDGRYRGVEQCSQFYARLNAEVAALPGVESSATCDILPLGGFYNTRTVVPEGSSAPAEGQGPVADVNTITPGYFAALGMKLLSGRNFTDKDDRGSPAVVIVSDSLAQHLWPGASPLGRRIGGPDPAHRDWMEVVGVVPEIQFKFNPNPATHWQIYRPMAQTGGNYFAIVVRTSVPPDTLAEPLRQAVRRVDPDQAVYSVASVDQELENFTRGSSVMTNGLTVMALAGLLLSTLGLYGVVASLVSERTNEIGVRMAMGARSGEVVWLILRQGARLALLGIALGSAGAWGAGRLIASMLAGVESQGAVVVTLCALLLGAVTLLACWLPARRAAKVDPMTALRAE